MTGLMDVPAEVILEHLLPALPVKALGTIARVNKHLNDLASDETLWLNLTRRDFAFSPTLLAPPPPPFYRRLYLGMYSPQTYVWGSSNNSRLGNASDPRYPISVRSRRGYIDTPAALTITNGGMTWSQNLQRDIVDACQSTSGTESTKASDMPKKEQRVAVVEMVAGGWSFTVRDQDGAVYVWGQLDGGRFGYGARGWEDKHCQVPEPTVLPLPCQAESISSGRTHLLILDQDNLIWELKSWGRAYHHTAASLTSPVNKGASARPHHIIQVSAGWSHSACLTSSGEIHLWFPFSDDYGAALTPDDQLHGPLRPSGSDDGDEHTGRDLKWGQVEGSVVRLTEMIPTRPILTVEPNLNARKVAKDAEWEEAETADPSHEASEDKQKVIKIASGADFLLALKANGEVWACSVRDAIIGAWIYLPWFSGPAIKHISAQFEWFTSYPSPSSGVKGGINHARLNNLHSQTDGASISPVPLPTLEDKTIIQIALGDHHHVALTSQGEVWTWGDGANGQLGLGDGHHNVETPRKVKFPNDEGDHPSFVFGITAGGWHTGALVLGDLRSEKERERRKVENEENARLTDEEENVERGGIRGVPEGSGSEAGRGGVGGGAGGGGGMGIGNHQLGAPFFRVGFAGRGGAIPPRGGFQSGGSGGARGGLENPRDEAGSQDGAGTGIGNHQLATPFFRVGFAGRGAAIPPRWTRRGGSGSGSGSDPDGSNQPHPE